MKTYAELPRYLAHWDLAFMPFAMNEATRFISPTKTPEFLAGGLRTLSTPVTDVARTYGDLVSIVATPDEAVGEAERLMSEPAPGWLDRVDAKLADQSWDRTWGAMHDLIDAALSATVRSSQLRTPADVADA